jgi:hypothetical protein
MHGESITLTYTYIYIMISKFSRLVFAYAVSMSDTDIADGQL